jgi:hypothetical protein
MSVLSAFYRRPILALARMILDPGAYIPQSEKKQSDLKLHPGDVLAREELFELQAAQRIMKNILQFMGIKEADLRTSVESTGANWFERGETVQLPWNNVS